MQLMLRDILGIWLSVGPFAECRMLSVNNVILFVGVYLWISSGRFSVTRCSRGDVSYARESESVIVCIDLTDVTLVSEDTFRRLRY